MIEKANVATAGYIPVTLQRLGWPEVPIELEKSTEIDSEIRKECLSLRKYACVGYIPRKAACPRLTRPV